MAAKSAQDFVLDVLVNGLGVGGVVVGADFQFGKGRAGNATVLAYMGEMEGFGVTLFDPVAATATEKISSTADPRGAEGGPARRGGAPARPLLGGRGAGRAWRRARPHHRLSHRQHASGRLPAAGLRRLCRARHHPGGRPASSRAMTASPISASVRCSRRRCRCWKPSVRFRRRSLRQASVGRADRLPPRRDEPAGSGRAEGADRKGCRSSKARAEFPLTSPLLVIPGRASRSDARRSQGAGLRHPVPGFPSLEPLALRAVLAGNDDLSDLL